MKKTNLLCLSLLIIAVSCKRTFTGFQHGSSEGGNATLDYALTSPQIKPLPVVWKEEWESGSTTPGDHTQHMQGVAYSESDPERIYMGQDVSNVWVSRDFGMNWFTLRNQGLGSHFVLSIEVDPLDKNRILAAVNCRPYDFVNLAYQGIYLSTDGGINWQQTSARQDLDAVRSSTKMLAYAPTSKNHQKNYATTWYAAFGEGENGKMDDGFLTSADGGQSWQEIRKLPAATFGETIRGIKVHVTNPDKVFLYGNMGLFRFEDATNPNGAVTKLSGTAGLPEGDVWGALYQSKDGSTLIVAVAQRGIYKSTDGGNTWNEFYAWQEINYCYVGQQHPNMIFAVPREKNGAQIRVSNDSGVTWASPEKADIHYRPGYDQSDWNRKLNGQFSYVLPDPRNPRRVFMHTKSKNFRSTDGGLTWNTSDNGFNGAQHNGQWQEQMFDPANPDRFCYFMVDRAVCYTDTRGRWFYPSTIKRGDLGLNWQTCISGALHPTEPVILASVGQAPVGKLLRSPDNGQTWSVVSDGNKQRWVISFDLKDPNYCYQWRERSTDAGLTWSEMPMPEGAILAGVSRSDARVLYALDFRTTGRKVWRSVDRGDSWEQVIQAGWNLTLPGPDVSFVFRVHPENPNIVYTSSANGHITKWDVSTLPATSEDITITGGTDVDFSAHRFAIDPRHPNVMYAINQRANTGNKFFRTIDGGVNWQNLSDYITQGSVNGLAVSPVTGEVYISSENGSMVMLPPYPTSNTAYDAVPYTLNHLNAPYK